MSINRLIFLVMKKILVVSFCALCALTASAQRASSSSSSFFSTEKVDGGVQFGIRAGLNMANVALKEDGGSGSYSTDSHANWHVGVIADMPLMQSLYVQTGLFLSTKGYKVEGGDEDEKWKETANPMYLQIPVLASYRYNFSEATQLQFNVGPYFAYGLGGKIKETDTYEGETEEVKNDFFGDKEDAANYKRFDCGLQIGLGFTFAKHYYVGAAYEFGFVNFAAKDSEGGSIKNKNWMIRA